MFSKILFSTLLLFSSDVFATSFDCKKAQSPVEKLICSDPKISSLDEKLARDYKSAIQSRGGSQLIAGQRKWITEVRDKCLTSDCLINAYDVRDKWLLAGARPDESCNFSEPDLLKHWKREKEGDFEEFLLSTDGHTKYFSSWLHHRTEMMGNWTLEQCDLHIYHSGNKKISFDYKVLGLSKGVLTIKDVDSDRKYRYKIIP
jgi:uncharacterized protein YecT (DUF1311 family)